jgi:hypothetical protein
MKFVNKKSSGMVYRYTPAHFEQWYYNDKRVIQKPANKIDSKINKINDHYIYIVKLNLFHYTPRRRLGGEEV